MAASKYRVLDDIFSKSVKLIFRRKEMKFKLRVAEALREGVREIFGSFIPRRDKRARHEENFLFDRHKTSGSISRITGGE